MTWEFIPRDILFTIGRKLEIEELWKCRRVCKNWNQIMTSFDDESVMPILTGIEYYTRLNKIQRKYLLLKYSDFIIKTDLEPIRKTNKEFMEEKNKKPFVVEELSRTLDLGYVSYENDKFYAVTTYFEKDRDMLYVYTVPPTVAHGIICIYEEKKFCFFDIKTGEMSDIYDFPFPIYMQYLYRTNRFLILFKVESNKCIIKRFDKKLPKWIDYDFQFDITDATGRIFNHNRDEFYMYDKKENKFHTFYPDGKFTTKDIKNLCSKEQYINIQYIPCFKTCLLLLFTSKNLWILDLKTDEIFLALEFPIQIKKVENMLSEICIDGESFRINFMNDMIRVYKGSDRYAILYDNLFQKREKCQYVDNSKILINHKTCKYGTLLYNLDHRDSIYMSLIQFDWKKYFESKLS